MRAKLYELLFRTLFIAVGITLGVVPLAGAQAPNHRIAVLTPGQAFKPVLDGLREGLSRLGYEEKKNLIYIVDETEGGLQDLMQHASRLIEAKPDLVFTVSSSHTSAAKKVTDTVPIVFAWPAEPI